MKKMFALLRGSTPFIIIYLFINTCAFAQLNATQICFYMISGGEDVKLKNLKPSDGECVDDPEILSIFNSAAIFKPKGTTLWHGCIIGTFTDRKKRVHLLRLAYNDGYILDETTKKTYIIQNADIQKKWYHALNSSLRQVADRRK